METQLPAVRSHLIREIVNVLRIKENGDALAFLALANKEGLLVLQHVVNEKTYVVLQNKEKVTDSERNLVWCYNDDDEEICFTQPELKRFVVRYIRKLTVSVTGNGRNDKGELCTTFLDGNILLPKLDFRVPITELTIKGYVIRGIPLKNIVESWQELEVLKVQSITQNFLDEVRIGSIQLENLRSLELTVEDAEIKDLLTMTPKFPFPEEVTFSDGGWDVEKLNTNHKFPQVKRINFNIRLATNDKGMFNTLQTIIQYFPCAEVAVINLNQDVGWHGDHMKLVEWHDWVKDAGFAIPTNINYLSTIESDIDTATADETAFKDLKSIGFKEEKTPNDLIIEKQYPNVKVVHRVHRDVDDGYDDDYYEEMLQHNEAMGYEHLYYGLYDEDMYDDEFDEDDDDMYDEEFDEDVDGDSI